MLHVFADVVPAAQPLAIPHELFGSILAALQATSRLQDGGLVLGDG
jgi:hypothetical protein